MIPPADHTGKPLGRRKTMMRIEILDQSQEIEKIKKQYPEYYKDEKAVQVAAEFWGVTCNNCGVTEYESENLVNSGGCQGIFRYCETSKGCWLIGISAQSSYTGFGYAPSVWDTNAFHSYHDAKRFVIERLIDFFTSVASSTDSCNSDQNRKDAKTAVTLLIDQRTPQLSLF